MQIFTDGSKITDPVSSSAAVFINSADQTILKFKLPPEISILGCELYAIYRALVYINQFPNNSCNYIVFTDSKSSLMCIKNRKPKNYAKTIYDIHRLILLIVNKDINITFHFVPSHKNISGNETADAAANRAHSNPNLEQVHIDKIEKVSKIKYCIKTYWEQMWNHQIGSSGTGQHLRSIREKIEYWPWANNKVRAIETVLAKLRIGHANYGQHRLRFHLSYSPLCDCGEIETIDHIFFNCNKYSSERQTFLHELNLLRVDPCLKNILGGGPHSESLQFKILESISKFLHDTNLQYVL